MKIKLQCDIHIDQIGDRGGWGFGMSSLEAMSMGLCCMTQIDKCAPYIKDHPFIDEYKLFNTPTYVLINNKGEKIVRRVGTFNPSYFKKYLACNSHNFFI